MAEVNMKEVVEVAASKVLDEYERMPAEDESALVALAYDLGEDIEYEGGLSVFAKSVIEQVTEPAAAILREFVEVQRILGKKDNADFVQRALDLLAVKS